MKQPRLAEMVASSLREQIVTGELADGSELPTLDTLVNRFEVSPPSVREALRILEHEGLITVRRGNVGGAVVHSPSPGAAAYTVGLVLQSKKTRMADLRVAMRELEPVYAGLCAAREDRAQTVIPALEAAVDRARTAMDSDDALEFQEAAFDFHAAIIESCDNETLQLVGGALASLWRAQDNWTEHSTRLRESAGPDGVSRTLKAHEELLDAIASGDVAEATEAMRRHVEDRESRPNGRNPHIMATGLRPRELATS